MDLLQHSPEFNCTHTRSSVNPQSGAVAVVGESASVDHGLVAYVLQEDTVLCVVVNQCVIYVELWHNIWKQETQS